MLLVADCSSKEVLLKKLNAAETNFFTHTRVEIQDSAFELFHSEKIIEKKSASLKPDSEFLSFIANNLL
mgnify:CR=1 FL=1